MRQLSLKPQDMVAAVWIGISKDPSNFTFAKLATTLAISVSESHAAVQRCMLCGLLSREFGELRSNHSAIMEFLVHGMRYVYPPIFGPIVQGMRTGGFHQVLASHFHGDDGAPIVWPDPQGEDRGMSLCPLYPTIPEAAKRDPNFYEFIAILDAMRAGSSREREIALVELQRIFR